MEYTVCKLKTNHPDLFSSEVNRMIGDGWLPLGGVAVLPDGDEVAYFQSMTRDAHQREAKVPS